MTEIHMVGFSWTATLIDSELGRPRIQRAAFEYNVPTCGVLCITPVHEGCIAHVSSWYWAPNTFLIPDTFMRTVGWAPLFVVEAYLHVPETHLY